MLAQQLECIECKADNLDLSTTRYCFLNSRWRSVENNSRRYGRQNNWFRRCRGGLRLSGSLRLCSSRGGSDGDNGFPRDGGGTIGASGIRTLIPIRSWRYTSSSL